MVSGENSKVLLWDRPVRSVKNCKMCVCFLNSVSVVVNCV
jgi:hypothetical protein